MNSYLFYVVFVFLVWYVTSHPFGQVLHGPERIMVR